MLTLVLEAKEDEADRQFLHGQSLHCKQNEARYSYTFRLGVLQKSLEASNSSRAVAVSNGLDDPCCGESATRS